MKSKIQILLIYCLVVSSCAKEDNKIITETIPFKPNHNVFIEEIQENSQITKYNYSPIWRVTSIQKLVNQIQTEKNTFVFSGNIVTNTNNKNNTSYKYFLNKSGYADSLKITEPGLLSITEKYLYNNLGMMIRKNINALINNVPYSEYTDYIYQDGNLIKSDQTSDNSTFTTVFEYYLDSTNVMAGTLEATTFIPQSKNLIKKETTSDETFRSYTYAIDQDGNWVTTITNEQEQVNQITSKLIYLK
ncbi:MAG: hypothetical protein ACEQSR_01860 [Candidatus Methylacidiphilales bacterium]